MQTDPRIDDQIAKAAAFAQPILTHLRSLIHATCPVTETIKWGRPFFLLDGKPFCFMAAFKAHAIFGFWKGQETGREQEAGGQFGRLTSLADLPGDAVMTALLKRAAAEDRSGKTVSPMAKRKAKPPLETPGDLAAALGNEPAAQAGFDGLPPGARREYIEWIAEAKRPETREKRIAKAVEQLRDGKKLNWKYEDC